VHRGLEVPYPRTINQSNCDSHRTYFYKLIPVLELTTRSLHTEFHKNTATLVEVFALQGRYAVLILSYRSFGTAYPSHLEMSSSPRAPWTV